MTTKRLVKIIVICKISVKMNFGNEAQTNVYGNVQGFSVTSLTSVLKGEFWLYL